LHSLPRRISGSLTMLLLHPTGMAGH
jgi:hypothetical protein